MLKSKSFLTILITLVFYALSIGQTSSSIKSNAIGFLNYLTKDGGKWKAKNEAFKDEEADGFPYFLIDFESHDSMSIRAKISGIDTRQDTILFWELWEFYAPEKNKTIFIQRAPSGIYALASGYFPSENRREGELNIHFPDGRIFQHKDTHLILSPNRMSSASYDLNPDTEVWEDAGKLIWIRQINPQ